MLPTTRGGATKRPAPSAPSSRFSPPTFWFLLGALCTMGIMTPIYTGLNQSPDFGGRRRSGQSAADRREALSVAAQGSASGPFSPSGVFNPLWLNPAAKQRPVIVITPTYERTDQAQVLLYLAQTLAKVPEPLIWIVVEDPSAVTKHDNTARILHGFGMPNTWLLRPITSCDTNKTTGGSCDNKEKHRGLLQRNLALYFVREGYYGLRKSTGIGGCASDELRALVEVGDVAAEDDPDASDPNLGRGQVILGPACKGKKSGRHLLALEEDPWGGGDAGGAPDAADDTWTRDPIVYLADDDNVYDSDLFDLIRNVRRVGVMPVGFIYYAKYGAEAPVVVNHTAVLGWRSLWCGGRRFPVDMAGVAFSASMLQAGRRVSGKVKRAGFPVRLLTSSKLGWLESDLLHQMVPDETQLEPVAGGELVMVYHMKSLKHREQYFKRGIPIYISRVLKQPVERSCSRLDDGAFWGP